MAYTPSIYKQRLEKRVFSCFLRIKACMFVSVKNRTINVLALGF